MSLGIRFFYLALLVTAKHLMLKQLQKHLAFLFLLFGMTRLSAVILEKQTHVFASFLIMFERNHAFCFSMNLIRLAKSVAIHMRLEKLNGLSHSC